MNTQLQLRGPFPRHPFAHIASCKTNFHFSTFKSTVGKQQDADIDAPTVTARDSSRVGGKAKTIWFTGLGIFATGLYYVLVNGPSRSAPTSASDPLSPSHFTPLTLTASTACTPYTKLLTLTLPAHLILDEAERRAPPIFSIYVKDSDIQVERPYTPLDGIDAQGQMRFWVKRYQGGEVGRWLHERKVGDVVEVRGPVRNWDWKDGDWDEIVMVSGGTGITPFYQLLKSAFSGDALPRTRFTLLHSSPTPLDLPPPELLDPLQAIAQAHPNMFSLRLFVDSAEPQRQRQGLPKPGLGRIGRKALEEALMHISPEDTPSWWQRWWRVRSAAPQHIPPETKILFLVCGPEPMTAAIAGPRSRAHLHGAAGGVLGEMGFESAQVWKL